MQKDGVGCHKIPLPHRVAGRTVFAVEVGITDTVQELMAECSHTAENGGTEQCVAAHQVDAAYRSISKIQSAHLEGFCPKRVTHRLCPSVDHQRDVVCHAVLIAVQRYAVRNLDILHHFNSVLFIVGVLRFGILENVGLDHAVGKLREIRGHVQLAIGNGVDIAGERTRCAGVIANGDRCVRLVCHKVVCVGIWELGKQNDVV